MATEQDHQQSKPQVPLRAKKHTRTVTGSLVASSGVITGLPSKHRITAGDRIDISVTGTPPVALENGVVAASDMSGYLGGALGNVAYLRIDQAQSLFNFPGTYPDQATARAAMEAVFTLGRTVYFDSGIFAGASINVGELAVVPGQTVHDDTTPGLLTGYWYLILNLSTAVGFPALAAFASETAVSPAISVNDSAGGNITASGLIVTASGANSVTIPTGLPDIPSFPDLTVHEHSEVADVLLAQELETASLKVGGESIIAPVSKILYSGSVSNLKVIWSGYDNTNTQISGDNPHKAEITPTDVFNVGVNINLIQILTHPTDNTIGVMLYQDIATSKIYLKSFRYTYEGGFTNSYTPFEIIGADSIDVRAGFVTSVNYLTKAITNVQLVVFGGKATPGTSVYAGAYTISLSTLAVVETNTWADTGIVIGTGTFTSLDRVIDAEYMSNSTTVRMGVTFGSGQFAYFQDLFTFIWDSTSAHIFYHSDIMLGQGSTRILVVNKEEMGSVILVQTGQSNMIMNGEYDTAYHEHLSFFNTGSMKILCERAGLFLNRVDILDIHGTSYLFTITTTSVQPWNNVADRLLIEMEAKMFSTDTYDTIYPLKVRAGIHTILAQMCTLLAKGHTIVCYGSTAKFTTVVNTLRLSSNTIHYIVDENPLKVNTFVPGTCIPVKSPDDLYTDLGRNASIAIVVSAWNFHTEIEAKIKSAGFANAYIVALGARV
jgi:hypothetical protein